MARSTYIYVVERRGLPYRAFTVKHELESWAEDYLLDSDTLWRLRDGCYNSDVTQIFL